MGAGLRRREQQSSLVYAPDLPMLAALGHRERPAAESSTPVIRRGTSSTWRGPSDSRWKKGAHHRTAPLRLAEP
jgi:hypothetical protein